MFPDVVLVCAHDTAHNTHSQLRYGDYQRQDPYDHRHDGNCREQIIKHYLLVRIIGPFQCVHLQTQTTNHG